MEFFFLITSSTMGDDAMQKFKEAGIQNFTQIPLANGAGQGGGRRFGNDIWPGLNTVFFVVAETDQYEQIKDWVQEYREEEIREGMKLINLAFKEII